MGNCMAISLVVLAGFSVFAASARRGLGKNIRGKVILVTGASQGMGASLCVAAAKEGATVIMLARTESNLNKVKETAETVGVVGHLFSYPVDCSDFDAVDRVSKIIIAEHGCPDAVVNCAGFGQWQFLTEMSGKDIKACMDAPYFSAVFTTKAFLPHMIKRNSGSIVNINSPAGYQPWASSTAYACGRWALRGLTQCLHMDLEGTAVIAQEVVLGKVNSEYFNNNPGSWERAPPAAGLVKPELTPEEAADVIIQAIKSGKETTIAPLMLRQFIWLVSWCPSLVRASLAYGAMPIKDTV